MMPKKYFAAKNSVFGHKEAPKRYKLCAKMKILAFKSNIGSAPNLPKYFRGPNILELLFENGV